jgi:hypothetical protein
MLELMTENVVVSEVHALLYVALSKEEKHAVLGISLYQSTHNAIAEV